MGGLEGGGGGGGVGVGPIWGRKIFSVATRPPALARAIPLSIPLTPTPTLTPTPGACGAKSRQLVPTPSQLIGGSGGVGGGGGRGRDLALSAPRGYGVGVGAGVVASRDCQRMKYGYSRCDHIEGESAKNIVLPNRSGGSEVGPLVRAIKALLTVSSFRDSHGKNNQSPSDGIIIL